MKLIMLGILLLTVVGCSDYNPDGIQFGNRVKITDGFYKGCEGYVSDETTWIGPCQHHFYVEQLQCSNGSVSGKFISVCDMEKAR